MMESPPPSSDFDDDAFDPAAPFRGIVVCCTSIPANERTALATKVLDLGGLHKYDLTPDVTHLIVGEHNTQKYKHVAKSRPDIRPMAIGWIDAVRNLWVKDDRIDFAALEKKWTLKPFETGGGALADNGEIGPTTKLLCCLSGFEDYEERCHIVDKIKSNGGEYTGSLDKTVNHLIVYEPTGKKYMAAKRWNLQIVALKWVEDSIERGMILDEAFYDPTLSPEDIGKGAWTKRELRPKPRAKRPRDPATNANNPRRKLRKTASMKLNSQRDNMWGEILGQQPSVDQTVPCQTDEPTQPLPNDSMLRPPTESVPPHVSHIADSFTGPGTRDDNLFASCHFSTFGFQADRVTVLAEHISSRGGRISDNHSFGVSQDKTIHRFVIVPQDSSAHTHPSVSDDVEIVTQFFIERCIHAKRLLRPQGHVLGRPFPVFPIEGFHELSICTSGFVDLDLNQVEKTVRQLGARYEERLNNHCSLLVCISLAPVRKAKLDIALIWNIPVVKAEWLWQCISQGKRLAIEDYLFPELEAKRHANARTRLSKPLSKSKSISDIRRDIETAGLTSRRAQSTRVSLPGPDMSAFYTSELVSTDPPGRPNDSGSRHSESGGTTTEFDTAQTHQTEQAAASQRTSSRPDSRKGSLALAEKSASDLNKAGNKPKLPSQERKGLARVRSEVCDSEAGDESGTPLFAEGDGDDAGSLEDAKKPEDAAEAEKRQLEIEAEQKAAAERRALTDKLTSLLEGASSDGMENRAAITRTGLNHSDLPAALPPPRRKRDIMGRAISSVSAASTESAESGSGGGRVMSRTHSAVINRDDSPSEEEPETKAPTATQLEYDDPEAAMSKARLKSKMLGRSSLGAGSIHKGGAAENRITMGGAGGRSMRRR